MMSNLSRIDRRFATFGTKVVLAVALLVCPRAAAGQTVVQAADGTVTVEASGASLGVLLDRLGASGSFQKLVVDPQVTGRPVTVTLDRVTVRQAVVQILNAAEVNYALTADDDGRTMRLIAGEVKFVADAQREMARDTAPPVKGAQPLDAVTRPADKDKPLSQDATSVSLGADTAQPPDPGVEAYRVTQLEQALTAPVVRPPVGSVIELPFTGPDGQPLTTIVQPPSATVQLPFPVTNQVPTPLPKPNPSAPQPLDQPTLDLLKALTAQPPVQR